MRPGALATLAVAAVLVAGALPANTEEATDITIFDFRTGGNPWPSIDDVVMGGASRSEMSMSGGYATFRGVVSLDNNGGFASVRSSPGRHDLSSCRGLLLRVRGDGKRYGVRLRTTAAFDGVSYQVTIDPPPGEWHEIELPFHRFEPVFRGRRVPGSPPLATSNVMTFGLIIADKQSGPFALDIEWIRAIGSTDSD